MVDDAVRRVFALSRQDIYFMIIIVMLGVQMAFNFTLIEPIREIQERIETRPARRDCKGDRRNTINT